MRPLLVIALLLQGPQDLTPREHVRLVSVSEMLARAEVRLLGKTRRLAQRHELFADSGTHDLFRSRGEEPLLEEFRASNGASSKDYLLEIELLQKPKTQPRFWILLIHRRTGAAIRTRHDGVMFEGSVRRNAKGAWDPTSFRESR